MSAFSHFRHTLNRLFKNCVKLCLIDMRYVLLEIRRGGGVKLILPPRPCPPGKTSLKKPNLITVNNLFIYLIEL